MPKDVRINVRVSPSVREEFQAVALLRGGNTSSLIHQFMVRAIREEKERNLQEFNEALNTVRLNQTTENEEAEALNTNQIRKVWAPVVKGSPIDPNWTAAQEAKEAAAKSAPPKRKAK